jgi:GNAT superfamily N-acetyltransferase
MLDYTLVSAKATYRLLTPQDVPIFLRLAQAAWAERQDLPPFDPQRVLATVKELQPARGKGTVYVFEREQRLAGFCFLVNCWSSAECGTVIVADELYVQPELRHLDLAGDFLLLLAKVAPKGSTSIRIELYSGRLRDRRASVAAYTKLGFRRSGRDVLSLRIKRA